QFALGRWWPYLSEVTEDGITDGPYQGVRARPLGLGRGDGEQFTLPVEVIEPKAVDLPCSKAIDGQEHENGAVADIDGSITLRHREQAPHLVPGWSGRQ